jgi:hypothetical protein
VREQARKPAPSYETTRMRCDIPKLGSLGLRVWVAPTRWTVTQRCNILRIVTLRFGTGRQ